MSITKVVKENNVDLIYAYFAYPEGLAGILAKKVTKKPLIVTLHGYNGFLVKPRSPPEIAEKIIWLIDPEEARRMSMNRRRHLKRSLISRSE